MSNELSGLNALAYVGVEPTTPPQVIIQRVAPTTRDINFTLGTLWLVEKTQQVYMLLGVALEVATWVLLFSSSAGGTTTFPCDVGTATEALSVINYIGDPNIDTFGSGNTTTAKLSNGSNGQVLLGGGATPLWKSITSIDGTIVYTAGVNALNLEVSGAIATSFPTDAGTATPAAGVLTVAGGSNINTSGAGNTITINLDTNVSISGTLEVDTLTAGVVQSLSSGTLFSNEGTDGQVLISSNTNAPTWGNITSVGNTMVITNSHNTINVEVAGGGTPSSDGFLAIQPSTLNGASAAGVYYSLGAGRTLTEITDIGSHVFPGNGAGLPATFTAPLAGKYYLKASMCWQGQDFGCTRISTSNRNYTIFYGTLLVYRGTPSGVIMQYAVADMDMGDTATFQIVDFQTSTNIIAPDTSMSGFFIC